MYNGSGGSMLEIDNNSIIICGEHSKLQLLKNIKKLVSVKIMSMSEFISSYYFDYDEKSIIYLINKYGIKYEVAKEYLANLIYIEDKSYNIEKLDFLVSIKRELIENNLLIFNSRFKNFIKDKNIIIYNYNLSKFEKHLLKDINYKEIKPIQNNYTPVIYEFDNIEEEVEFIARSISKLINDNVDINKIKLTNVSDDYINIITKIFNFYNLKIDKFNNIPVMSNIIGTTFLNNLDLGIEKAIESISSYDKTDTYNKIINICNKYIWCDNEKDLKTLIEYDLKHTYIKNPKYTNMIEVVDYKSYSFTDEYVFMLGFNQGIIPKIYKDEDYISDNIKPSYMDSTIEKNTFEKVSTISAIKNIKNLTITYKLKTPFSIFYPSNLIDDLIPPIKGKIDYSTSYSDIDDEITLANDLDELIKFGKTSDTLELLNSNYDIPYNTYSHRFTGLSINKLRDYIKRQKSFNLSYTLMDNYNRCAFRFYIDKILCLSTLDDSFGITLGNLYHHVLEKLVKSDIDIESTVNDYIKDNDIFLTNSNRFFVNRAIDNLKYLKGILEKQNSFSKLKKCETEKFVKIPLKDNINFVGFIDKIVYDNIKDKTIVAIIDYKTYVKKPSLKYIDSGIGLQLPVYMYLSSYSYKNINFAGFYLQNITLDNKSDEEKEKSLKLIGYTNTDKEILENFDSNYMDSSVIDGIKINKDGNFSSSSLKRMLSNDEIDGVIKTVREKIDETLDNVLDSKFDINPKMDKENIGCEFCKYRDLCFKKAYDFKSIKGNKRFDDEE